MKNNKKLLLALGTVATILAPVATVVSCGSSSTTHAWSRPELDKTYTVDKIDDATAQSLIDALVAKLGGTEAEAKTKVGAITVTDLQNFRYATLKDADKNKTITAINDTLLGWAFDHNEDKDLITGLQNWVSGSALSTFTSESLARGPWKTDESQGVSNYFRYKLLDLKSAPNFDGYDFLSTTFKSGTDDKIEWYNSVPKFKKGDRLVDPSFKMGSGFMDTATSNASFSSFRSHVEGEDHAIVSDTDGSISWDKNNAKTITQVLDKGLKVSVSTDAGATAANTSTITNADELKAAIKGASTPDAIIFEDSGVARHYAKAEKGKVVQGHEFHAKDLFNGLVRDLFSAITVRNGAKIGSQDLSPVLDKFTDDEQKEFTKLFEDQDSADAYNNPNGYLWDLYGVDLAETIRINLAATNPNKFILKFKSGHLKETSANLLLDNDALSPFYLDTPLSGSKITDSFKTFKLSKHAYSGSGTFDNIDGVETLAPYVFTEYGMSEGEKEVEQLAPDFIDSNKKQVKEFTVHVVTDGADGATYQDAHVKNFKNAGQSGEHEYILDPMVKNSKSLIQGLQQYKVLTKPVSVGQAGSVNLTWSSTGYTDPGFNDLGKKLLWGYETKDDIESHGDALKTFYAGTGAQVRDAIKASVNWYTMAQTIAPGQHKVFYAAESNTEEFANSNVDINEATPEYISANLKSIYSSNIDNAEKAWTSDYAGDAANKLEALAKAAGATEAHPAEIPVFAYLFSQVPNTPEAINSHKLVLQRLNSLTPFVKFGTQKELSWDDFVQAAAVHDTYPTILGGFGPDYPGIGTILQQYLSTNCTGGVIGLFQDILNK